ncbi:hypothetical protein [Sporosarcina saromensis]|uniref:hypothetical protein n=1 Tax=Sporosarcina saromensis TaxID=359365 RepID=UPI00295EE8B0|nr:hypothetical protein [Sporosarcina saromensis]
MSRFRGLQPNDYGGNVLSPIRRSLSPIRRGLSPIRETLSPSRQVHPANEMNLQRTMDPTMERAASLNYSIELSR